MPALAGEPLRGHAVIQIRNDVNGAGNMRGYTVSIDDVSPTAAAPGDQTFNSDPASAGQVISVTLRFEWDAVGVPLADAADAGVLRVRLPAGAADIGATQALAPVGANGVQTFTLRFDAAPLDAVVDAVRYGMLEILFEVSRGAVVAWGPADSRGAYAAAVAGTANHNARGYLRRTAVIQAHSMSNVALAGAEPGLWASPDSIFARITMDAAAYRSNSATLSLVRDSGGAVEQTQAVSVATANRDYSWTATSGTAKRVGSINAAASDIKDLRFEQAALDFGGDNEYIWAPQPVQQTGWTRDSDLQMTEDQRITVDPRITVAHLLQVDSATFGTPPLVNDVVGHDRGTSELGFAAARYRNSRAEGLDGLTVTETLADGGGLVSPLSQSATTATRGGETGWAGTFLTWDPQLPGGDWTHTGDVTTADLQSLEIGAADTGFTLLAANAALAVVPQITSTASRARHFEAGAAVRVTGLVLDARTLIRATPSAVRVAILRHDADNNRVQFLNSDTDNTSAAWSTWAAGSAVTMFPLAPAAGDSRLFFRTFSATAGWTEDVAALIEATVVGVRYYAARGIEITGSDNRHDGYVLDPIGLALSGVLGTR
ncbi:MAG: hypothetical protein ACRDIC_20950 [bacterium]